MSDQWQYQLRVYLDDAMAERAFRDGDDPRWPPLKAVLHRHDARMISQWQAFTDYVIETEAAGAETPLSKWTKATLSDPAMRAKHIGILRRAGRRRRGLPARGCRRPGGGLAAAGRGRSGAALDAPRHRSVEEHPRAAAVSQLASGSRNHAR